MAYIRKRGELQWRAEIRKKGLKLVSKTFETKKEADAWASVVESEMVRGVFVDRSESECTTIGDIIDRFTKEFAPFHYRSREDKKEAWRFQCAKLKGKLGQHSLAALDQKLVAGYRDDRQEVVSESTVRKELYMLSKILGFAEMEAGIALPRGNPVMKIRRPSDGRARDRRLTAKEWARFEKECRKSRNIYLWPAVELAVETAMRQGELLGLQWENIDLKRRFALLKETKNGEVRAAPLSPRAIKILKALPHSIDGCILPIERMTLYHVFIAAIKRAKIEDFTFHDLRHEAMSRLAERGDFSVLELSAFSGHKTLQMLKRYTHLQAENLSRKLEVSPMSCREDIIG